MPLPSTLDFLRPVVMTNVDFLLQASLRPGSPGLRLPGGLPRAGVLAEVITVIRDGVGPLTLARLRVVQFASPALALETEGLLRPGPVPGPEGG
jgi:hypothetical protein